jgi:hypothetical protein
MAFDKTTKGSTGVSTIRSFIFEDVVAELNSIIDTYVEQLTSTTPLKVTLTADLVRERFTIANLITVVLCFNFCTQFGNCPLGY